MSIPKLRFPEFSGTWENKKLKKIISSLDSGVSVNSIDEPIRSDGESGILKTSCISSGEFKPFENKKIIDTEISRARLNPISDTIIISRMNTPQLVGESGYVTLDYKNLFVPDRLWMASTDKEITNTKLLSIVLSSKKMMGQISNIATGTSGSMKNISKPNFLNLEIYIPTFLEQTKIANFLTVVDDKLTQLKKKKSLLEQYKKGVMQKLFSQELRFKDENGNHFAEWEEKTLGEITFKTGKKNRNNIQYPIYSINNKEGFIPQSDQFDGMDSNKRGYDISLYKIIEENTFAYNPARINVGSLGYSGSLNKVIISSLYVCFKTIDIVNDYYLLHFFNKPEFNKSVLTNLEGGVRQYLFYENFSRIEIVLPTLPEQTKIANFLTAIDDKINHCGMQIEKMEGWKKGLLQRMFV